MISVPGFRTNIVTCFHYWTLILQPLLATGNVDIEGEFGQTPLHYAATKGQTDCAKQLVGIIHDLVIVLFVVDGFVNHGRLLYIDKVLTRTENSSIALG